MVDFRLAILKYIDGKLAFVSSGVQRWKTHFWFYLSTTMEKLTFGFIGK